MKLAIRLLLLIIVLALLIATKISYFQTNNRNIFKNVTHAGYVDQTWFGALQKVMKNFESTSTINTTTNVTKTFDTVTKINNNNNNNNNETPANISIPSIDKITPPKLQKFLPSMYIYTAHREMKDWKVVKLFCIADSSILTTLLDLTCTTLGGEQAQAVSLNLFDDGYKLQFDLWQMTCTFHRPMLLGENIQVIDSNGTSVSLPIERTSEMKGLLGACLGGPVRGNIKPTDVIGWMELNLLLGVSFTIVYFMEVSLQVMRVLQYYEAHGLLQMIPWQWPLTNKQFRYYGQNLLLHDCLHRSRHTNNFTIFTDMDEHIVPVNATDLTALMNRQDVRVAGWRVRNRFHHTHWRLSAEELSRRQLTMVDSESKRKWKHGVRSKYIVRPSAVEEVGVHSIKKVLPAYKAEDLPDSVALLHHYRSFVYMAKGLQGRKNEYKNLTHHEDHSVVRFFPRLLTRVEKVCRELNICKFLKLPITTG